MMFIKIDKIYSIW